MRRRAVGRRLVVRLLVVIIGRTVVVVILAEEAEYPGHVAGVSLASVLVLVVLVEQRRAEESDPSTHQQPGQTSAVDVGVVGEETSLGIRGSGKCALVVIRAIDHGVVLVVDLDIASVCATVARGFWKKKAQTKWLNFFLSRTRQQTFLLVYADMCAHAYQTVRME